MTRENIFTGLKVVDVASFIAGPAAHHDPSDFGATVVKVEPPTGDPQRTSSSRPPYPRARATMRGSSIGRNKRSIALNLKDPRARGAEAPGRLGRRARDELSAQTCARRWGWTTSRSRR
jgi:formyl-CoA transferase